MADKTLYVILTANAASYRAALREAGDETERFNRRVDSSSAYVAQLEAAMRSAGAQARTTGRDHRDAGAHVQSFGDSSDTTRGQVGALDAALTNLSATLGNLGNIGGGGNNGSAVFGGGNGGLGGARRDTASLSDEVNKLSGRMRILFDVALGIGPALIPIGAVAVPAISGLANQLGIAALAGGSLMASLAGVGEAVGAVRDYDLNPTAAGYEKAREALEGLGPAARGFVLEINEFLPSLEVIRNKAGAGWFPGLTTAMHQIEEITPRIASGFEKIGAAGGSLVARGVDNLINDEDWKEFFSFLDDEGPATLRIFGETVGALTKGLAELWMATDPLNDDFSAWLLDVARGFESWADGLDQTQGFQDFVDYIRANGPQVGETLGSMADAVLQVLEAMAPLGGPILQALELFSDVIAAIADSPIGPKLIAMAAGFVVLNRALQVTAALAGRVGLTSAATAIRGVRTGIPGFLPAGPAPVAPGAAGPAPTTGTPPIVPPGSIAPPPAPIRSAGLSGFRADLRAMRGEYAQLGRVQAVVTSGMSQTSDAARRVSGSLRLVGSTALRAGAGAGAFAIASTEAGRATGLTNTAMLGLVGSMAGKWGGVAGASIGFMLDIGKAAKKGSEGVEELNKAFERGEETWDFKGMEDAMQLSVENTEALANDVDPENWKVWQAFDPDQIANDWTKLGGAVGIGSGETALDKKVKADAEAIERYRDNVATISKLGEAFDVDTVSLGIGGPGEVDLDNMTKLLEQATPAMDRLGISAEELFAAGQKGGPVFDDMVGSIRRMSDYMETTDGKILDVASALDQIGDSGVSAAAASADLQQSLTNLLSPTINAEASFDALTEQLEAMKAKFADGGFARGAGFLDRYSEGAQRNRELTRDYVTSAMERLTALAGVSTTTQDDMVRAVKQTRQEFIRSSIAAGMDGDAIRARAKELGLTPRLVRTLFQQAGVTASMVSVRGYQRLLRGIPKNVKAQLRLDGVPESRAEVDEFVGRVKGKVDRKTYRALLKLTDLGTPDLKAFNQALNGTGKKVAKPKVNAQTTQARKDLKVIDASITNLNARTAKPKVDAQTEGAKTELVNLSSMLTNLNGDTANIYITTHKSTVTGPTKKPKADGGIVENGRHFADGGWGQNGRYYQREPMLVAGGPTITWAEQETGFEAYISGKASQRDRNVGILSQTADRFGYDLVQRGERSYAASGRFGGELVGGGSRPRAATVIVRESMPDKMTLVVGDQQMTAYVRKHAGDVVDRRLDARDASDDAGERMTWS